MVYLLKFILESTHACQENLGCFYDSTGDSHYYTRRRVLAPFLGFVWSLTRLFIKAPTGRKRFNVLGALNAMTHELITVTTDTYITAESVCHLLLRIASLGFAVPITRVLDNARYQKCRIVWELAERLHIELLYLPAYSPNLNLILGSGNSSRRSV